MLIADLIKSGCFEDVNKKILLHYGDKDNDKFRHLFAELKRKSLLPIKMEPLTIFITACRETDDDSIAVADFDEDDAGLYFDVSGYIEGEEILYSIASSPYGEFLGYNVDNETIKKFSPETILAHTIYEITAFGFDKTPENYEKI